MTPGDILYTHDVDTESAKGSVDIIETVYGLEIDVDGEYLAHIDLFYLALGQAGPSHPAMQIHSPDDEDQVASVHWLPGRVEICIERRSHDIGIESETKVVFKTGDD